MASDVDKLSTIYANLPSIFEMNSDDLLQSSSSNEKTYQPMFGSFLFAESEPFTHAAFVPSTSSSIEIKPTDEQQIDEASNKDSTPLTLVDTAAAAAEEEEDDDDDEDDFDGIPIRHASTMNKNMFTNPIENDHHDGDEEELFLNDFIDEQAIHNDTQIPSLFNNIPDIDDLNEHLDDDDEIGDRIPFDPLDMLDESDSIRSSSPDSVLSSSHLRDDDDDDDVDDDNVDDIDDEMNQIDDVTQWNDEDLLSRTTLRTDRPNAPLPPQFTANLESDHQVNFIDSSRSNSRCSNVSSHLSFGYADQARVFLNDDDGLVSSSSESECDYEQDNINHWQDDRLSRENSEEEISLQVNLDYRPTRSISSASSHRSDSPSILDQSPIVAIDEDIPVSTTDIPPAPMANDDDDGNDDEEEDLPIFCSDQPVLSPVPLKNLFQLKNENRQREIVHEIINMRHILNEHENDDEFLAIMHNPTVFEDVLYVDDDQQQRASSTKSTEKKNESESIKHYQNFQTTSILSVLDNEKNNSSKITTTTTTNHRSSLPVNHLGREEEEETVVISPTNPLLVKHSPRNSKITQQSADKNIANINIGQITDGEAEQEQEEDDKDRYQQMSSDEESDNDLELFQTLAQLHDLVHPSRLSSSDINGTDILEKKMCSFDEENFNHLKTNSIEEMKPNILFSTTDNDRNVEQNSSLTSSHLVHVDDVHSDTSSSSLLTMSDSDNINSKLSSNAIGNDEFLEKENLSSHVTSFDLENQSVVERRVSDTLQESPPIEHFVERILSEAVYEIYTENSLSNQTKSDQSSSMDNLLAIMNWHYQDNRQVLDPFDQRFDSVWISHFQTPDDHQMDVVCPFDITMTNENSMKMIRTIIPNDLNRCRNDRSNTNDEINNVPIDENQTVPESVDSKMETSADTTNGRVIKRESFFGNQSRLSQFEEFASDQPLSIPGLDPIAAEIHQQIDESSSKRNTTDLNDEPWELEEHNGENLKPVPTIVRQNLNSYDGNHLSDDNLLTSTPPAPLSLASISISGESDDDENEGQETENYDQYFADYATNENGESVENPTSKTVRFSEKLTNVAMITPKASLNVSDSPTTSDSDETDDDTDEKQTTNSQTNHQHHFINQTNGHVIHDQQPPEVIIRDISTPRPESNISITESVDLPPPLPPLPPLNNKPTTTMTESKDKINPRSTSDYTPTMQSKINHRSPSSTDSPIIRPQDSAIIHPVSKDDSNIDSDEIDNVIPALIDNTPIDIDAKTISPFKCVINFAGEINEENRTAIITLYGCWLPDHRLREYRYIMDQLFYYVYYKLEKLVVNDYVLVYFHGATPKHRTPELKFLRKCYQMINFRLRKNLRAVYVVHPTRWLRTVIALSRPFFSNKFYHKVHYIFTIAELERQFPHNPISIPVIIEQTDWLYSQRYDRHNASIKRSIERSATRLVSGFDTESSA